MPQSTCHHCKEPDELGRIFVSGSSFVQFPAVICLNCMRLNLVDSLGHPVPQNAAHQILGEDVRHSDFYGQDESAEPLEEEIVKSGNYRFPDKYSIPKAAFSNPKAYGLRWITAHPHGEEPGVPLLVYDDGDDYIVVGGGGGKLDHTLLQKPEPQTKEEKEQRVIDRKKARQVALNLAKDDPFLKEQYDKAQAIQGHIKEESKSLQEKVLRRLYGDEKGDSPIEDVMSHIRQQAAERATKEAEASGEKLSPEEKDEFVKKAQQKAEQEAKKAATDVIRQIVDESAVRALGDESVSLHQVQAEIDGKKIVRNITPEEVDEITAKKVNLAEIKSKKNAILRALHRGDSKALSGIDMNIKPLSEEEVKKRNGERYLNQEKTRTNMGLILAARGREVKSEADRSGLALTDPTCSPVIQKRYASMGAMDGLNSLVASATGKSILTPNTVRKVGIEESAKIAAHYLVQNGARAGETAASIRQRIVNESKAVTRATLDQVAEMDKQSQIAHDAAYGSDSILTKTQAGAIKAGMSREKFKLTNTIEGQLRAMAALAHHLEAIDRGDQTGLSIKAGTSKVASLNFARELGLEKGSYSIEKVGKSGYSLKIDPDHISSLTSPKKSSDADRDLRIAEIRQDVSEHPGKWRPLGINKDVMLYPHQEIAVRVAEANKRVPLNYAAGSGKTVVAYGLSTDLLEKGKIDRVLITMPTKPRGQQEDYVDPETGESKTGEKNKFMQPKWAQRTAVIQDGRDLQRKIEKMKKGELSIFVISPELAQKHIKTLEEAGFAGDKSLVVLDEAHLFGVAEGQEQNPTLRSQAAKRLSKSEYFMPMTGTAVQKSGHDIHSFYSLAFPGELGSRDEFAQKWERAARSGGMFSPEIKGMLGRQLGGMLSYSKPVKNRQTGQAIELHRNTVTVKMTKAQNDAIRNAQKQYKEDRLSDDPEVRKSSALKFFGRVKNITESGVKDADGKIVNPKLRAASRIVDSSHSKGQNKIGFYSFGLSPLRRVQDYLSDRGNPNWVRVTGAEDDKAVRNAVKQINDPNSGVNNIAISSAGDTGLNLQGLDRIVKMGVIENQGKEEQLDHRHLREGATSDKYVTTILSDNPMEQKLQYIARHVRQPQVALLAQLADDTGYSAILGPHLKDVQSVAKSAK